MASGKLWNRNFFLLWQGQLVSELGIGVYNAIMSFWVLDITGSKAMMGTILACQALPRVLLGPFAGAYTDRHSRKWIIVWMDLIRGLLFGAVGLMAIYMSKGNTPFPSIILYPVTVISGIASAFFSPAIISAVPDLVPIDKLTKANSLRAFSQAASNLLGFAFGGWLYSRFQGPPIVFFTGMAFLFSAITEVFMSIPNARSNTEKKHILLEMWEGMKYTFRQSGIRTLITIGMFLNFFVNVGITLLAPLFNEEPGYGVELYGAVMATLMAGQLVGMLLVSSVKNKASNRYRMFYISIVALIAGMIPVGLIYNVYVMLPLALMIGTAVSIMTVLLYTLLQITVQPEQRGRVFGIMSTVFEGLVPVSMAVSGFAAELAGVRPTILGSFSCAAVVLLFTFVNQPFRVFLKSEPVPETSETEKLPSV